MNFTHLENFLNSLPPEKKVPGCNCIVYHNHKKVFEHSVGVLDLDTKVPFTTNTQCFMYSITKVVTAVAALQLWEQGKYGMNEPLFYYLPEFKTMNTRINVSDDDYDIEIAKNRITIHHLLTMTAGFNYDFSDFTMKSMFRRTDYKYTTREFATALSKMTLMFEPGTAWRYSFCYDLLGALIEVISGMPFAEYVKKNIFDPLDMKDSSFSLDNADMSRFASVYSYDYRTDNVVKGKLENSHQLSPNYTSGGAGMISTAEDCIKLAEALCNGGVGLNGNRILASSTIDLMRADHVSHIKDVKIDVDPGYSYGIGVRTMVNPALGGAPANCKDFGWSGLAGSHILIDPEAKLSLFYTQSVIGYLYEHVQPRLRNMAYTALEY